MDKINHHRLLRHVEKIIREATKDLIFKDSTKLEVNLKTEVMSLTFTLPQRIGDIDGTTK